MGPLLLRGIAAMVLAIVIAAGAGLAIGRAGSDPTDSPEILATKTKLLKAAELLRKAEGPPRRRLRKVRRQLGIKLHRCPQRPRGKVFVMPDEGIDLVVAPGGRGAMRIAMHGASKRHGQPVHLCTPINLDFKHRLRIMIGLAALALVVGLVILLLPTTRRLRRIEAVVRDVADGRIDSRCGDENQDVIGELARAVDEIGERTEGLLAAQRRLQASVSHELRTPLARLAAAVDLAEDHPHPKLFAGMRQDIEELDQLVEEMLTMARLQDRSVRQQHQTIDIAGVARSRVKVHRRSKPELQWSIGGDDQDEVQGDRRLLSRLIDNLLSNAARHARTQVELTVHRSEPGLVLTVDDDGDGVPEAQRPLIFRAFQSGDRAGSAGLGLAICSEIASAHGASIEIADSPLGGARFLVTFPA